MQKKPKKIFMENYDPCSKEKSNLIIVPNGEAPTLYLKRKPLPNTVSELTGDTIWASDILVSVSATQDDYNKLVDWWFDNISETYIDMILDIADNAIKEGFDTKMSVEKARNKLKVAKPEHRKSNLGKFLSNWVSTGCARYVNKKLNGGIY